MDILIVEDELPAYKRLCQLLVTSIPQGVRFSAQVDSIRTAVEYLRTTPRPDLIFMDIQLSDGLSFSIFEQFQVESPVIFTTAFDQYALKAFQVHSIDYLLKPIEPTALEKALKKYERFYAKGDQIPIPDLQQLIQEMQRPNYRERFLVKTGNSLSYLKVDQTAYFYSEQSLVFARRPDGKKHHLDTSLDQVSQELNPADFFRISRKAIIHINAILKIDTYFNGRLLLQLSPTADFQVTVSRDRVNDFKAWLDR